MVSYWLCVTCLALTSISSVAYSQNQGRGRLLTIPVLVDDESGIFLIDTGSGHSVIDHSFARQLGLKQTGHAQVRQNYSLEDVPTVAARHFQFGNKAFSDVSFLEIDLERYRGRYPRRSRAFWELTFWQRHT